MLILMVPRQCHIVNDYFLSYILCSGYTNQLSRLSKAVS